MKPSLIKITIGHFKPRFIIHHLMTQIALYAKT